MLIVPALRSPVKERPFAGDQKLSKLPSAAVPKRSADNLLLGGLFGRGVTDQKQERLEELERSHRSQQQRLLNKAREDSDFVLQDMAARRVSSSCMAHLACGGKPHELEGRER